MKKEKKGNKLVFKADHEATHLDFEDKCLVNWMQPELKHCSSSSELIGLKFDAEPEYSDQNASELNLNSPMTTPNRLNQANRDLNLANDYQPMFWEYFFAQNSNTTAGKGSIQSRGHSLRNCYVFKKKGLHSVLTPMEEATFKPGVQSDRANGDSAEPSNSVQSWFPMKDSALDVPSTSGHFPTAFRGLNTHGPGLLDFYIEDDELKDEEELFSSFKHQDLRSNLQQLGVFDAGASSLPFMISTSN